MTKARDAPKPADCKLLNFRRRPPEVENVEVEEVETVESVEAIG
jgi:hypothetical protein